MAATASSTLRQRIPVEATKASKVAPSSASSDSEGDDLLTYGDFPSFTPSNYTMKDLLGAIPAHCFERSAIKSGAYVVADFAMIGALMYAASFIEPALGWEGQKLAGYQGLAAKWAAWATYWVWAGFVYTGVWICGESRNPSPPFRRRRGAHLLPPSHAPTELLTQPTNVRCYNFARLQLSLMLA